MSDATSLPEDAGPQGRAGLPWRIDATARAAPGSQWLAIISIALGRASSATHFARVAQDGKVWMPASLPAEVRKAAAPAVAAAAAALLAEGRT